MEEIKEIAKPLGITAVFCLAASLVFGGAGTYRAEHEGRSAHVVKFGIGYTHLEDKNTGRKYTNISLIDSYNKDKAVAQKFIATGVRPSL